MCGIAGIRRYGNDPITGEEIILLLTSIEHRGQHATGIALVDAAGGVSVYKDALPAWRFTKSDGFLKYLEENLLEDTQMALLHTRWATKGNPEVNANNHPMFDGTTAIIHNGGIMNDDHIFASSGLKRTCETDSDAIRAIVAENGFGEKGIRELNKLRGSAAIACVSSKYPGELLLARSGSPLVYGFPEDASKLYWASEARAIIKASRPFREIRGVWVQDTKSRINLGSMPDNTAWLFGPEGMTLHREFRTLMYQYVAPDYSKGNENYHSKKQRWRAEAKRAKAAARYVQPTKVTVEPPAKPKQVDAADLVDKGALITCPSCGILIKNVAGKPWADVTCPACKSAVIERPFLVG